MGHIFISYSKKDQRYARKLAHDLLDKGFDVWIDDRIDYGERWFETVIKAIDTCDAIITIMSPNSQQSNWVKREIHYAEKLDKPALPLLLKLPAWPFYGHIQYEDVTNSRIPSTDFYLRLSKISPPKSTAGSYSPSLPPKRRLSPTNIWQMIVTITGLIAALITIYVFIIQENGNGEEARNTPEITEQVELSPTPTQSPTPTNTPTDIPRTISSTITTTPSLTPIFPTNQNTCRARVDTTTLNFRKSPDTSNDGNIIREFQLNDEPLVIGRLLDNSWFKVEDQDEIGWIFGSYITLIDCGSSDNIPVRSPIHEIQLLDVGSIGILVSTDSENNNLLQLIAEGNIMTIDPTNSSTEWSGQLNYPILNNDGTIVYVLSNNNEEISLWEISIDEGTAHAEVLLSNSDLASDNLDIAESRISLAPSEDYILITLQDGTGRSNIYSLSLTTSIHTPTLLIENGLNPTFVSNDEENIIFERDGQIRLYRIDDNSENSTVLYTPTNTRCFSPVVELSSDLEDYLPRYSVLFICQDSNGNRDIYHLDSRGILTSFDIANSTKADIDLTNINNLAAGPNIGYVTFDDGQRIYFTHFDTISDEFTTFVLIAPTEGTIGALKWTEVNSIEPPLSIQGNDSEEAPTSRETSSGGTSSVSVNPSSGQLGTDFTISSETDANCRISGSDGTSVDLHSSFGEFTFSPDSSPGTQFTVTCSKDGRVGSVGFSIIE